MKLNKDLIKELIPHRDPFLFIDECDIIEKGKKGIANKIFLENEYFFEGHFPKNPIVPGVIIVEAMAQAAGVVISNNLSDFTEKSVLFMSVNKAKFRKPVLPNYKVNFEVELIQNVKDVYKFKGLALHNQIRIAEAEFTAMITYK